jgi:hypothetical protein
MEEKRREEKRVINKNSHSFMDYILISLLFRTINLQEQKFLEKLIKVGDCSK